MAAGVALPGPVAVPMGPGAHEMVRRGDRGHPELVDDREPAHAGTAPPVCRERLEYGVEARAGHAPELETRESQRDVLAGPDAER